jgi:hypothetical protein
MPKRAWFGSLFSLWKTCIHYSSFLFPSSFRKFPNDLLLTNPEKYGMLEDGFPEQAEMAASMHSS